MSNFMSSYARITWQKGQGGSKSFCWYGVPFARYGTKTVLDRDLVTDLYYESTFYFAQCAVKAKTLRAALYLDLNVLSMYM